MSTTSTNVLPRYPGRFVGSGPLKATSSGGVVTLTWNMAALAEDSTVGNTHRLIPAFDPTTGLHSSANLSTLIAGKLDVSTYNAFVTSNGTALGNKQPLDATLTALAGVTTAADRVIYATGPDVFTTAPLTSFGRSLIASADSDAARTVLNFIAVPSGAVTHFAMTTPPSGWLECSGAAVSRSTFANLFAAIGTTFGTGDGSTTFNLPDLRGQFVRGWDHSRGVDSGRAFGTSQTDALQGHLHQFVAYQSTGGGILAASATAVNSQVTNTTSPTTDGTNGTPRTAAETRPVNVALLPCIKT